MTKPIMIDKTKKIYDALVSGLRKFVSESGYKKVVIGLSGGIDSALVAVIASDALSHRNVIGMSMPGPFSTQSSVEDARLVAVELGIDFRQRPIAHLYDAVLKEIIGAKEKEGLVAKERSSITVAMENLQARLRAVILMYIANDENALLLATGNKSEIAMGYCTLYGDTCGAINILGDVYKTEVYKLVYYRNSVGCVIPDSVINKVPSAELRPNQKDEDSLPPYDVLDEILRYYIDEGKKASRITKILAGKASPAVVNEVILRFVRNEYKRRQAPPIICLRRKNWIDKWKP
ncbi:MAG: NAD(+) synthase [Candidatus Omnitrophica bacterium]|nr:NAD(+) synthase [Candidatus Omnitrophota bacterium]